MSDKIFVIGCGNFGTALAIHLASMGHPVTLSTRKDKTAHFINSKHTHPTALPGIVIPNNVTAVIGYPLALISASTTLIFAVPSQVLRKVLIEIKPLISPSALLLFVNKGIEIGTGLLVSDMVGEELGGLQQAVFLSGPSFAMEVAQREPTCVSVASMNPEMSKRAVTLFHDPLFRVYLCSDVIGMEVAGALKNVMAIAAGASSGLGHQQNTRAALITRSLAEITRIGVSMGADPMTFLGLSGIGDLLLTCTSSQSRNYTVGYRIAQGEELEAITNSLGSIAEGVTTTLAAFQLITRLQVDAPIITAIYSVLYQNASLSECLKGLLMRDPSHELRGIKD